MPSLTRRHFVQLALAAGLASELPLQSEEARVLLPVNDCGRWGFINAKGTMAVAARYEAVFPFASGLAAARIKGLWGYIDSSGSFVLPPKYDEARNFHLASAP
jgi:hypothetical protein